MRRSAARARRRELARVVGVDDQPHRPLGAQRRRQLVRHAAGIGDRDAGVDADDLDMRDRRQRRDDLAEPARRQHQRIAAGQDHLADRRAGARASRRRRASSASGQHAAVRADMLAAETEAAIDRADEQRLEQRAVGIAMHDALDRRQRVVGDRIGALVRRRRPARAGRGCIAGRSDRSGCSIRARTAGVTAIA